MSVQFKPIAGHEGYRVGDDGSVWTRRGRGPKPTQNGEWKPMKLCKNHGGYLMVTLRPKKKKLVHRLVLEAFVGPCPDGMEGSHYPDPTKDNCRLDNLRWETRKENCSHKIEHGSQAFAEDHHASKLNWELVDLIRTKSKAGVSYSILSQEIGISKATISQVVTEKTWKRPEIG